MGATVRCAGCGHTMPADARLCLLCGRPAQAAEVELERLDAPSPRPETSDAVVVERRGPRAPKGPLVPLAAIAVVLALVVAVWSNDGGDRAGGDESAPTTEQIPSTTAARVFDRDRGVEPQPSTSVTQLGPAPGPLLGEPTGGLSVYAVTGRSIARVELDTGVLTVATLSIPRVGGQTTSLAVRHGQLYVGRDLELLAAPLDLSHPAERVHSNVAVLLSDQHLVVHEIDPRSGAAAVRQLSAEGHVVQEWPGDDGSAVPGMLGDRLIVVNAGRLYTVGEEGIRQYAVGEYIASNSQWLLWWGCDESMQCAYHLGDQTDPYKRRVDLMREHVTNSRWGPLLAPNGETMVVADRSGTPILRRTSNGEYLARLDFNTRPTWSPDGEWLFTRSGASTVVAISTRYGQQTSFSLRGLFGTQSMWLAVG